MAMSESENLDNNQPKLLLVMINTKRIFRDKEPVNGNIQFILKSLQPMDVVLKFNAPKSRPGQLILRGDLPKHMAVEIDCAKSGQYEVRPTSKILVEVEPIDRKLALLLHQWPVDARNQAGQPIHKLADATRPLGLTINKSVPINVYFAGLTSFFNGRAADWTYVNLHSVEISSELGGGAILQEVIDELSTANKAQQLAVESFRHCKRLT